LAEERQRKLEQCQQAKRIQLPEHAARLRATGPQRRISVQRLGRRRLGLKSGKLSRLVEPWGRWRLGWPKVISAVGR
jgi:hypothetical protein